MPTKNTGFEITSIHSLSDLQATRMFCASVCKVCTHSWTFPSEILILLEIKYYSDLQYKTKRIIDRDGSD